MFKKNRPFVFSMVLAILALGVFTFAFAQDESPRTNPLNRQFQRTLVAASTKAGVEINPDELLTMVRGRGAILIAPIRGFEHASAVDLPSGQNMAFAYISRRGQIPAGYYTLRVTAENVKLGDLTGRVQFIAQDGSIAGEVPATIRVNSLTVPTHVPERVQVVNSTQLNRSLNKVEAEQIWIICSNGEIICF